MYGFLGVGQAGGNIANHAAKIGYRSIAINYSQRDLESLDQIDQKLKLVGSEGVGKKRDDAIKLMSHNIEMIQEFVINNFSTPAVEVIVVPFSTGGGTGSGVGPLLTDFLSSIMPNKVIVACPILPDYSESMISQYNALKTSEELSGQDVAVFPIDNQKARKHYGKHQLYQTMNEKVVSLFDRMYEYTKKHSSDGVLDKKDLLEILKTKGVGLIAEVDLTQLNGEMNISAESVIKKIQDSWNQSAFVPPEHNKIMSAGIIFDAQNTLMDYMSQKDIFSCFNNHPTFIYEGIYHNQKGKVLTMITGLSMYKARLNKIEKLIQEQQSSLEVQEDDDQYTSSASIDLFSSKKPEPKTKKSPLDILSKYQR